jgi:hypothetical protein
MCNHEAETQSHFITCMDIRSENGWQQAATTIRQRAVKLGVDPILTRLLTNTIQSWRTTPHPATPTFLSCEYLRLFRQQSLIGWDHILKGRLTKQWSICQNRFAGTSQGINTIGKLVATVFTQILILWKTRCDAQHGATQLDIDNKLKFHLAPQIHALYASKSKLNTIDREQFNTPIDTIMALPIQQLEHWIHRTTRIVKAGIKRASYQDRLQMRPIQSYFLPTARRASPASRTSPAHSNPSSPQTAVHETFDTPGWPQPRTSTTQPPRVNQQNHTILCQHPSAYKPP